MRRPFTARIPDRHSAHAPGKAEWKEAGNRLNPRELSELTAEVARVVQLRPASRPPLRVP
jgi:hypothetical protein